MFDISRLQTQLNNTGLQNKDTPLYQFLNQLIGSLRSINTDVSIIASGGGGSSSITNLTQILQTIALGDDYISEDSIIPNNTQQSSAQNVSILFSGEVPTGLINSSNKLFTTAHTYLAGFLAVYLNGDRQIITQDYTETSPTTFTFVNAPTTGDIVLVDYVQVAGVSGTIGATGAAGVAGSQGIPGNTIFGEDGIDGNDGFPGPAGSGSSGGSSGALVLLEQHTASSSASLDFTTAITSLYDEYLIELVNLVPATNAVNLLCRMSVDGGATYDTGNNYQWASWRASKSGSAAAGATATSSIGIDGSASQSNTASLGGICSIIHLFQPLNTSFHKRLRIETAANDGTSSPDIVIMVSGAYTVTASAVNAIRFLMSSGNIASGTIRMYGLAKT